MQKEFSYPIIIDDLDSNEKKYHLKADADNLLYLCEVLKVPDVKSFEAEIKLKFSKKEHTLNVWGKVKAEIEHQSVISLEYFTQTYEPSFELVYDTKATYKEIKEIDEDIDDDVPDIIINGKIDLVDVSIEQIALVLDDYPRKKGEKFNFKPNFDEDEPVRENPFAVLRNLK